jgi:putative MATE family efflux protein
VSGESEVGTDAADRFSSSQTDGVRTLLGDPKKAIIRLSIPMIVAMAVQTVYNVVDGFFVSTISHDALDAVGFFFPFFFTLIALSTGIGIGASSALSRRIGARDKDGSDNVAIHSLLVMMGVSAILVVGFLAFQRPMFVSIGAGPIIDLTLEYSTILFAAAPIMFFVNWATAILRGEGDVKRAMYAIAAGSVLNIFLDWLFIWVWGWGVGSAAWATAMSMGASAVPLLYWMFAKRDTYVTMRACCFSYSRDIMRDILRVGLPASVMQLAMSMSVLVLNGLVANLEGHSAVGVFTTGWRVVMIAILPLIGIAAAVTAISGAAFGAREYGKLSVAYHYALRIGFLAEVPIAVVMYLVANPIARVFSTGEGGEAIIDPMTVLVQIMVVHFPFVAFGMFSSALFQGTGRGMAALTVTILRTLVFTFVFAYLLAYPIGMGLAGVWWGIVLGNIGGAIVAFVWAKYYIAQLDGVAPVDEPTVVTG